MELSRTFYYLGIALGLGLLVGLQRERAESRLAGFRTFPLVTLLGTVCALLSVSFGGWTVEFGLAALAGVIVVGGITKLKTAPADPGLTTEVAMLLMYGVGAYLPLGHEAVAVAVGGGVAVLLHLKPQLHSLAARIEDNDFKAVMQFVLITLVILPVLPNRTYGPYEVLNPHKLWLLVVLIVGISLAGYVALKWLGRKAGTVAAGILGGLISSTATTVSYSRRAGQSAENGGVATLVIMIASAVVFARVLAIIGMTAPRVLPEVGPPIAVMLLVMTALALAPLLARRGGPGEMPAHENPTELKSAVLFALLFGVVLVAVAAAKENFGDRGLYVVGVLSGLTDMDAITLSTVQMIDDGKLDGATGWRLIVVASMANLVFKTGTVAVLGGRHLAGKIVFLFSAAFVAGALLLWLWPA